MAAWEVDDVGDLPTLDDAGAAVRDRRGDPHPIHESKLEGEEDGDGGAALDGVRLGELEALQGVVKFPVRIKCATLAWTTLEQGLDESATLPA